MDGDKFLGVGLKTALLLWVFFMILTPLAKSLTVKYPIKGVSEIILAN